MPLYALFADLERREVLVVGGGEVAARKVEALLHAGARVCVCAPELAPALAELLARGRIEHRVESFRPEWLDDVWLVVAATDDAGFNARLAAEASQRRRLANIVDDAALSSFQVPAVVDRDPLLVAVSSSGAAPMLARRLRVQLETQLDPAWGALARLFARHRDAIRARFPDLAARRRWYEALLDGPILALLSDDDGAAERMLLAALRDAWSPVARTGSVVLVGLVAGGSEHLSLRALRAMQQADCVVAHAGIDPGALALARRDAPRVEVPAIDADTLRVIVSRADEGERVLVLWPDTTPQPAIADALGAGLVDCPLEVVECAGSARRVR